MGYKNKPVMYLEKNKTMFIELLKYGHLISFKIN